jgi:hypothetical protein
MGAFGYSLLTGAGAWQSATIGAIRNLVAVVSFAFIVWAPCIASVFFGVVVVFKIH